MPLGPTVQNIEKMVATSTYIKAIKYQSFDSCLDFHAFVFGNLIDNYINIYQLNIHFVKQCLLCLLISRKVFANLMKPSKNVVMISQTIIVKNKRVH